MDEVDFNGFLGQFTKVSGNQINKKMKESLFGLMGTFMKVNYQMGNKMDMENFSKNNLNRSKKN